MICDNCNIELKIKNFPSTTVKYCDVCGNYHISERECEHDFILVLFRLSNGGSQLRKYCRVCHYREPKSLKQAEYDMSKIRIGDNDKYNQLISDIRESEIPELRSFTQSLSEKQDYHRHKVYYDYINSPEWKEKSRKIQERHNHTCQICGTRSAHTHHLTYAHFMMEYDFELVPLCEKCHMEEYHSPKIKKLIETLIIPKLQL